MSTEGGKRLSSVERAFEVIETLRGSGPMRIEEVGEELNLPTSTAHVHLKTLESVGYVVKDDRGYRLGLRFLRDGIATRGELNIFTIAKPEIDILASETGEVVNLGVEENGQRVLLYQSEGSDAIYDNAPTGEYTNMHWTALGKAMLAHLPDEYVESIIDTHGLTGELENTITNVELLYEELSTIREQGFTLEDEERREGIRSIAVPIIVEDGLVGAISISGPKERFNDQRIQETLLPELKDRVNVVEVKYAYD